MPAGSSSERPAKRPGPTTAASTAIEPARTPRRRDLLRRVRTRGPARADHAGVRLLPLRYVLALCAVALACAAVFAASGRSIERQKRHDSQEAATVVTATLSSQVAAADAVLEDTAGFLASSEHVTRSEFANYAVSALRTPAIRWMGFAERIPGSAREAFEREHGVRITIRGPDDRLLPAPRRGAYFPTLLGAGERGQGRVPVGFDSLGDPLRTAAMREALRTRRPAA